jgi:dihydroxy-acid dehydratase
MTGIWVPMSGSIAVPAARRVLEGKHYDNQENAPLPKGCGPKGYPGMPEVGNMPIPRCLVKQGVRDMVRVSDARMSGTAFGTVVLHVAPEANAGGPLALVKTGDRIRLNAREGVLELKVSEAELAERRQHWTPDPPHYSRGYARLYIDHVMQADRGADLDFLVGKDTRPVTRESH